MKLHLGCGKKLFEGWVNVDILPIEGVHQDDVTKLETIPDGSCDLIYACHVLEHIGRKEVDEVLALWRRKLKPEGVLRIAVPDFGMVFEHYKKDGDLPLLLGFLMGGQRDEYDYHKMIFDQKLLSEKLLAVGFGKVEPWDWREVEHGVNDDYSQAYLPHMDKEDGMLMSLNLQALNTQ